MGIEYLSCIVTIRDTVEIEYSFCLYDSVNTIFSQFKLFSGWAYKLIRDALINEPINHTGIISNPGSYTTIQINPVESLGFDDMWDMLQDLFEINPRRQ
jgi:hypothetical protein